MFSALMVTALLSCKPYVPQHVSMTCEGADQVQRINGREVSRFPNAPRCSRAVCEGGDFVRRDSRGLELERWSNAASCMPPPPPRRLTLDEPVRFGLTARR